MKQSPLPPAPRQVRLPRWRDDGHRGTGLLTSLALGSIGIAQLGIFLVIGQPWIDISLDRSADRTTGEFAGSDLSRWENYDHQQPVRVLRYQFSTRDGRRVVGKSKSRAAGFYMPAHGEQVVVEYLEVRPHWSRIQGTRHSVMPPLLYAMPVAFLVAAGGLAWVGLRARRRLRMLLELGEEVEGVVTGVRVSRIQGRSSRESRPLVVGYRYTGFDGSERRGSTSTTLVDRAAELTVGDMVRLLVDPLGGPGDVAFDLLPPDLVS